MIDSDSKNADPTNTAHHRSGRRAMCTRLAIILLALHGTATAQDDQPPANPATANLPTQTVKATAGHVEISVVISAIEQINVPARAIGPLTSLTVEEGQEVREGDLLATIDSQDAELAVQRHAVEWEAAKARVRDNVEIDLAKKSLAQAEADMKRADRSRRLYAQAISDEELEHRKLVVDQTRLQVRQAELQHEQFGHAVKLAELDQQAARQTLARCRIPAPVAGIVVEVKHRAGEWVEPGETVVQVMRTDRLRAEGFVPVDDVINLKRGQTVRITVNSNAGGTKSFDGILKFVSPEIVALDGRARVWAEIDNPSATLYPGTRATMEVFTHAPEAEAEAAAAATN